MPAGWVAVLLVVAWVVSGLVSAVFLRRSGRASGFWWFITVILGPFSLPLAFELGSDRHTEVSERTVLPRGGTRTEATGSTGPRVRALAGVDGSLESRQALGDAVEILGDRLGTLVLVHVLDYDSALIDGDDATTRGHAMLAEAVAQLPQQVDRPMLEVAVGRPADALIDLMERESADLLILGHRGQGMTKAVLGSVSDEVVRRSGRPVLVGGGPRRDG